MAVFGPLDFFSEGTIEFVTFIGDDPVPQHTYRLDVTIDESLKLDA